MVSISNFQPTQISTERIFSLVENKGNSLEVLKFPAIFSLIRDQLSASGTDLSERFVMKLDSVNTVRGESILSNFLKSAGFNTPQVLVISGNDKTKFWEKFKLKIPSHISTDYLKKKENEILIMNMLSATNIDESFNKLSAEERELVLGKIGEISVFDIITMNNDRAVRFSLKRPFLLEGVEGVGANTGNIMLDFSDSDSKSELEKIYFIDSTPRLILPKPSKSDSESSDDDGIDTLFGSDESDYRVQEAIVTAEERSESKDSNEGIKEFTPREVCTVLLSDPGKLAEHIALNLETAIDSFNLEEDRVRKIALIKSGVIESLKKIEEQKDRLLASLEGISEEYIFETIEENIEAILDLDLEELCIR